MKRFLSLGMLALSWAGMPTQEARAEVKFRFGVGFNFSFEYTGNHQWGRHGCFQQGCNQHGHQGYMAVMPGHEQVHAQPNMQAFPPQPAGERRDPRGERKEEEATLQWGYPSLGYSYYHPVSYQAPRQQEAPTYYYPQQYYYPPSYQYPNYYQAPGMTFDR